MLKQFLKHYWKSIFVFCLIFYVTILHTPHIPRIFIFPHQDKWIHFIMFFSLTAVIYRDIIRTQSAISKIVFLLLVLVLPIVYGGLIEILQGAFIKNRTADWLDFLANTAGALFAFLPVHLFIYKNANS